MLEATRGGTRRHLLDLLPALTARGIECELVFSPLLNPQFGGEVARATGGSVPTYAVPMERGWRGGTNRAARFWLQQHLRHHHFDIVHCHSSIAGMVARMQPLHGRRPAIVYTPHCIAFDTRLPLAQRALSLLVERRLSPRTARFIAVSQHEATAMLKARLATRQRITTIHNGIDLAVFDRQPQLAREELGIPASAFVVGSIDRLTRQKNQAELLCALPLLLQLVPESRVLLVGSGEDHAHLLRLAQRLNVANAVTWIHPDRDPRCYYSLCDVIAHPSLWDSCPYTILEAMAARRPVVASEVGGVSELLGRTPEAAGYLYPSGDTTMLADYISLVSNRGESGDALGASGRRRVENRFELTQMIDKTVALYEQVNMRQRFERIC